MYLVNIEFIGAFPDGDKVVKVTSPNGGGNHYHLMVDNFYWGIINNSLNGWRVAFTQTNSDYSAGDLQPLIDLIVI